MSEPKFSPEQAKEIGEILGIDWTRFDIEQFRMGLDIELEHGSHDPSTDVTQNDPILTGKIALAHLNEIPDYYTRLQTMEAEAEGQIARKARLEALGRDTGSRVAGMITGVDDNLLKARLKIRDLTMMGDDRLEDTARGLRRVLGDLKKSVDETLKKLG